MTPYLLVLTKALESILKTLHSKSSACISNNIQTSVPPHTFIYTACDLLSSTLCFSSSSLLFSSLIMEVLKQKRKKKSPRFHSTGISFSASMPDCVQGVYADSICAVMYSTDPFADIRGSILEIIGEMGVSNWEEMEELVYCYVVLNSSEIHGFIVDAFLSLCS